MKLRNKTRYETGDLRRIIQAAHDAQGVRATRKFVEVVYSRGQYCTGRAAYSGGFMVLRVPKINPDVAAFARVIEHEVAHGLGIRHEDMDIDVFRCTQPVPWAEGLSLREREPKSVVKVDRIAQRHQHALEMKARWERRSKAASRKLAKWRRVVKYYEKKREAAGSSSKLEENS